MHLHDSEWQSLQRRLSCVSQRHEKIRMPQFSLMLRSRLQIPSWANPKLRICPTITVWLLTPRCGGQAALRMAYRSPPDGLTQHGFSNVCHMLCRPDNSGGRGRRQGGWPPTHHMPVTTALSCNALLIIEIQHNAGVEYPPPPRFCCRRSLGVVVG